MAELAGWSYYSAGSSHIVAFPVDEPVVAGSALCNRRCCCSATVIVSRKAGKTK